MSATQEYDFGLDLCFRKGKAGSQTVRSFCPVDEVFQLQIHWAEVLTCLWRAN